MHKPVLQLDQSSFCSLHCSKDQGKGGPNDKAISIKKIADRRRQKSKKIIDEKREKYRAKNGSRWNISTDSKRAIFVIFKNQASALIKK